jgi:uridine kinase
VAEAKTRRAWQALDELAAWLLDRRGETSLLAIDGHSAAGKSTFATALARRTGAALVRGDDFYRVMDAAVRARLTPAGGVEHYYDWQRMRDEVLQPLRQGKPAIYHPYDWDTGTLAEGEVTVAGAFVIVEGLFVSRPQLLPLFDRSVLVDTKAAARGRRQAARADASDEWLARWEAAERYFFQHVRPPHSFDMIVRGDD